jgi:hypothetical protein
MIPKHQQINVWMNMSETPEEQALESLWFCGTDMLCHITMSMTSVID